MPMSTRNTNDRGRRSCGARAGMTLIEVMIASGVIAVLMMASAAAFTGNMQALGLAKSMTSGTIFLETVHEDLMAQPYGNLLSLNGNQIHAGISIDASDYRVDLTIFLVQIGLIQVRAQLIDLRSGRELTRLVFIRSEA